MNHSSNVSLIRNASVEVVRSINAKKQSQAIITVNNKFTHTFSASSRVSKHLDLITPGELQGRLNNGTFLFVEGELVDFRDGFYNGFIHTDKSIEKFVEIIGYQKRSSLSSLHQRKRETDDHSDIKLRKVWSDNEITVPGYQSGGDFNSQLSFVWNPFVKTINSAFDIVRLICENGAIGTASLLNSRIPLENRWEEHLDIASRQIQNKVSSIVVERVKRMTMDRASVNDCLLLEQHSRERLSSPIEKSQEERKRLTMLMAAVSPHQNLSYVYKPGIFVDKNLASQLPSHLTSFDVYNIATEMRTHTTSSSKSSDNALDKIANELMFDRETNYNASAAKFLTPKASSFADPEMAFFGKVHKYEKYSTN